MTDMTDGYRVLDGTTLPPNTKGGVDRDFAFDVLAGLSERPKRLPSRYFYDKVGSDLFQQITELDAYYPTRSERQIFEHSAEAICAQAARGPFNLIEFGAGDGRKTFVLLDYLTSIGADFHYVPIDISEAAMAGLVTDVRARYPKLPVDGLVCEYFEGLQWLAAHGQPRRALVLFLGSNIGNFDRPRARAFLRRVWTALRPNDEVLIGFDLKKDIERLLTAYNDPGGVTARFNLHMLERINNELGGDFQLDQFRHYATYNVFSGAMESYLVSRAAQDVRIDALSTTFRFAPWEPIHTEYSYKYLDSDIDELSEVTGWAVGDRFYDRKKWFVDALLRRLHGAVAGT